MGKNKKSVKNWKFFVIILSNMGKNKISVKNWEFLLKYFVTWEKIK